MTDCSLSTKRLRFALLASLSLPSVLLAVAPNAVNDDLRTTDPVAANASLVLAESKLITNDSGDDKAVKSVTTPSSDGATVSWDGTNVTYTPGDGSSDVFLALDTGEHEDDSFTYTLEGSDGDDDTATVQIRVTGVNDTPTLTGTTGTANVNDNDNTNTVLSGVNIGDPDVENVTVTITVASANGEFDNYVAQGFARASNSGNYVYTYTGSTSNAQSRTQALNFVPVANLAEVGSNTNVSVSIRVEDEALNVTGSKSVAIASINDRPDITVPGSNVAMDDDESKTIFSGVTIVDPDPSDAQDVEITYDDRKGSFPTSAQYSKSGSNANAKLTISNATVSSANSIIQALVFTPEPNQVAVGNSEELTFSIKTTDEANTNRTRSVKVDVTSVNEPPVVLENGGSTAFSTSAGGSVIPYSLVNVTDPDVEASGSGEGAGDDFTAEIALSRATGTDLGSIVSTSFSLKSGSTNVYTYTAAIEVLQDAIRALTYIAPADAGVVELALTVTDAQDTTSNELTVEVTSSVPNPGISGLEEGQEVFDNSALLPFSAAIFNSFGTTDRVIEIALDDDQKGTFDILGDFQYDDTVSPPVYRMTGNAVEASQSLQNIRFNPTPNRIVGASDTVQFTIQMLTAIGGTALNTDILTITVFPVNDAPIVSSDSPTYRINDDETEYPYQSLQVSDPDEGGNQEVTVTLSLSGDDSIAGVAGVLTLDVANVDVDLKDFGGQIVFPSSQYTFNDQSNADPSDDTITIGNFLFDYDDTAKTISFNSFVATPDGVDPADFATLELSFDRAFDPDDDVNTNNSVAILSFFNSAGSSDAKDAFVAELDGFEFSEFIGEPDDLNAILDIVLFTPTENRNQDGERETVTFTLRVADGNEGVAQVSDVSVVVLAVDGAPEILGVPDLSQQPFPVPGVVDGVSGKTEALPFVAISISDDVDPAGPATVTVEIALDNYEKGTLSGGGFIETGSDTGVYTLEGTLDAVNAALDLLEYELSDTYGFDLAAPGATEFTIRVTDSSPAANVTSATYGIVVREPIVSRVVTLTSDYSTAESAIAGSFRKAIADANNNDFIVFDFASDAYPAVIRLKEPIVVDKNLTIVGPRPANLTISGDTDGDDTPDVQLFTVTGGAKLTLEQLTLKHGTAASYGGAVSVETGSSLCARFVSFEENDAGQFGGAIDVFLGSLDVRQCLFYQNKVLGSTAFGGGAISIYTTEACSIINSTFVENKQDNAGGLGGAALYVENSDLAEALDVLVEHCTFKNNVDAALSGSAVLSAKFGALVTLRNTLLVDEQGMVLDVIGGGKFNTLGGNIATDNTETTYTLGGGARQDVVILDHEDDQRLTDPLLLALADNAGPTLTCALDDLSLAKGNAVSPTLIADSVLVDQRGVWRGSSRDSGAFQSGEFKRININEIYLETGAQFLEFYNPRESAALDMQGLKLYVDGTLIYTFASSLSVDPGAGFVLEQSEWLADFELNAEAGQIVLKSTADQTLLEINYVANFDFGGVTIDPAIKVDGQSIVRYPNFEGPYLPHRRVVERVTGVVVTTGGLSSSGEDVNGAPLNGGNAPPIAVEDEEGYALFADETLLLDVLANDVEFDRTDTLEIDAVMSLSSGTLISTELDGYDGGGNGSYTIAGLSPDSTRDASQVSVTVSGDPDQLLYNPINSPLMIALSEGETTVDVWAYTIQDYASGGAENDRDPNAVKTDAKRAENLKRATSYFYVTVTGVNEAPDAADDGAFSTPENQAIRLMADTALTSGSFDFEDQDADYMDFDGTGAEVVLTPVLQTTALLANDNDVDNDDTNTTIELINVHQTSTRVEQTTATSLLGATVTLDIRANRSETHIIYDPRSSSTLNALSATDTPVEDSFYYTVIDRHGAIGTAKVTVLVSGVNDVPTANDDTDYFASEDGTLQITEVDLLANDTDPDQDGSDAVDMPEISSVPSNTVLGAVLSFDGTTITYDPTTLPFYETMARNEIVIDEFTYEISDGNSGTSEATVFIEFVGVNDTPTAEDDTLNIDENQTAEIAALGLLDNDEDIDVNGTDPDDDIWVLPQRNVTTALGATLNIETDGSYSYDANSALIESLFEGEQVIEVFPYTITDNSRTSASDDNFKIITNRTDVVLPVLVNDFVAGSARTAVTAYSDGGGNVVIESDNHQLRDGLLIQIEGYAGADDYNGVHAITVVDRDHFSIPLEFVDDPDGNRGTWRPWFNITAVGTPDRAAKLEIADDAQTLVYSPKANFYGTETFTYTIEDGAGGQDVATVEMLVIDEPLNSFLVAKDDVFVIYNDQDAQIVDVLANDNMLPAPGSDLFITETTAVGGASGTLSIVNGGKSLSYEPATLGLHEFTYTVTGGGTSATEATVQFNVIAPEAFMTDSDTIEAGLTALFLDVGENYVVAEDSSATLFDVLANDETLAVYPVSLELVEIVSAPSNGTAEIAGDQVSFTPDASFTGGDSFTYRVRDELGNELTKTVNVTVVENADDFYAVEDHYIVWAGSTSISLPVLTNDIATGANSTSLSVTNLGLDTQAPPEADRVAFNGTSVIYSAPASATSEIFTYEIGDGTSERREAAIVITVVDAYPALDPQDDLFTVAKNSSGHSLDVLLNDTAFPLVGWDRTITAVSATDNGGSVAVNAGATLDYSPAADFNGIESFTYTVEDAFGQTDTATVTVMVGMQITGDDEFVVLENTSLNVFDVLVNDDLLDRYETEYKIVEMVSVATTEGGEVSTSEDAPNNYLLYTPADDFVGEDTFTYEVVDDSGNTVEATVTVQVISIESDRDSAFLRVTVTGVNDSPVLLGVANGATDDKISVKPFPSVTITDIDEGGNQLQTVTVTYDSTKGTVSAPGFTPIDADTFRITDTPANVTTALQAMVYTPFENLTGAVVDGTFDVDFDLELSDGYITPSIEATATITVTAINDAPEPVDDSYSTSENQAIRMLADATLLSAAFDFGDLDPDFQAVNAVGATVTLTPVLQPVSLLANDDDVDSDDDNTTIELINIHTTNVRVDQVTSTTALGATVTLDIRAVRAETNILYDPRGSAILNALRAGEQVTDSFYYTVRDQHGALGIAKVDVVVTGVNDVPTANEDGGYETGEDSSINILGDDVLANDTDPDIDGERADDDPIIVDDFPKTSNLGANLTFDGTNITYDPSGVAVFEALARNEFIEDFITYTITDEEGGESTSTISLEVEGFNDRPIAENDLLEIDENDTQSRIRATGLISNDTEIDIDGNDPNDDHWIIPQREVTTPLGAALDIETDGSYTYDANSMFIESMIEGEIQVETFPYIVIDNFRTSSAPDSFKVLADSTDVLLPVLSNDDVAGSVPVAVLGYSEDLGDAGRVIIESTNHALRDGLLIKIQAYSGSGAYNGVFPITVVDVDHFSIETPFVDDPAGTRGTWRPWFNITAVSETDQEGVLTIDTDAQAILYTPKAGFSGTETFEYTIEDGVGGQDVTEVSILVLDAPLNTVLSASDDRFQIGAGESAVEVDVLANDNTAPALGTALTITQVTAGSAGGLLEITNAGKTLSYTPVSDAYTGTETFTYTVSGGGSSTTTASISIEVIDRVDYLDGSDDNFFVVQDSVDNVLDVAANDASLPSFPVSFSVVSVTTPNAGGSATVENGKVNYSPAASYVGVETFNYTIRDASGGYTIKTVTVQVVPTGSDFYAQDDRYIVLAGSPELNLPVLFNDGASGSINPADLDIYELGLDTQAPPDVSRVSFTDTAVQYTAPATTGVEIFNYEIDDGTDQRREATITVVIVDELPTKPNALDDNFHVEKNATNIDLDVLLNDIPLPNAAWAWTIDSVGATDQGGTAVNNGGTSITYTPANGFYGVESFDYTIIDAFGDTSTATVTIDVGEQLTEPDTYVVLENSSDNDFPVLVNDDILERFPADYTISATGTPDQGGVVTIDGSGPNNQLLYTPAADFDGIETFTYTVIDKTGATLVETVTVEVITEESDRDFAEFRVEITGVNDIPVLAGISNGATTDKLSVKPFPTISITDKDGVTQTVDFNDYGVQEQTVIMTYNTYYGTVATPGMTSLGGGRYRVIGTPAHVTAVLQDVVFTPYENLIDYIDPGQDDVVFSLSIDDQYVLDPVTGSVAITITPIDDAPTLVSELPDMKLQVNDLSRAVLLPPYFADVDDDVPGGQLTWSVSGNTNPGLFDSLTTDQGKQLLVIDLAQDAFGIADITVRGTDRGGLYVEDTFRLTVDGPPVIDLPEGEDQPLAASYISGSQSGFTRDYRQSFRVTNEGLLPAQAFVLHVTELDRPVEGIQLIQAEYSSDENGTPDNFGDDTRSSDGVTVLQPETYYYMVKYDLPLEPGESVVVHLRYRATSVEFIDIRPNVRVELTTASPTLPLGTSEITIDPNTGDRLITVSLQAGVEYRLEYSADLVNWTPWATALPVGEFDRELTLVDDGLNTDTHPSLVTQRFYRLVELTPPD